MSTGTRVLLAGVLLVAALLRFTGLGWGLRHPPHVDEAVYVENVVEMVKAGDLDHRYYNYPGLFFYLLAPGVTLLDPAHLGGARPFLVSRAFVAAVSLLNVALLYAVGSRLLGRGTGLLAAALLAVSPLEVETGHQVRPDVLLEGFGILALWAFSHVGPRLRDDLRAGAVIGLATAVKFTGLLMVPFYVAARLLRPGRHLRGLVVAGALSVLLPALFTPYAFLHLDRYWHGPVGEMGVYYSGWAERPSFAQHLAFYLGAASRTLGPVGVAFALLGAILLLRRSGRDFLPPLLHPATVIVVMATASVGWPRLLLPGMGILYLCAAHPVASLHRRVPLLGVVAALAVIALPLGRSAALVNLLARPSPADEALDWITTYVPPGARILETRIEANRGRGGGLELGVDPARHEILTLRAGEQDAASARLIPEVALVITDRERDPSWSGSLLEQHKIHYPQKPSPYWPLAVPARGPVAIRLLVPREKVGYVAVDLHDASLSASGAEGDLGAVLDDDPVTAWSAGAPGQGPEWIEVGFPHDQSIAAVEVYFAAMNEPPFPVLRLEGARDAEAFRLLRAFEARPALADQHRARARGSLRPLGARLVFESQTLRRLRILQVARRSEPWSVAALRVEGVSPAR